MASRTGSEGGPSATGTAAAAVGGAAGPQDGPPLPPHPRHDRHPDVATPRSVSEDACRLAQAQLTRDEAEALTSRLEISESKVLELQGLLDLSAEQEHRALRQAARDAERYAGLQKLLDTSRHQANLLRDEVIQLESEVAQRASDAAIAEERLSLQTPHLSSHAADRCDATTQSEGDEAVHRLQERLSDANYELAELRREKQVHRSEKAGLTELLRQKDAHIRQLTIHQEEAINTLVAERTQTLQRVASQRNESLRLRMELEESTSSHAMLLRQKHHLEEEVESMRSSVRSNLPSPISSASPHSRAAPGEAFPRLLEGAASPAPAVDSVRESLDREGSAGSHAVETLQFRLAEAEAALQELQAQHQVCRDKLVRAEEGAGAAQAMEQQLAQLRDRSKAAALQYSGTVQELTELKAQQRDDTRAHQERLAALQHALKQAEAQAASGGDVRQLRDAVKALRARQERSAGEYTQLVASLEEAHGQVAAAEALREEAGEVARLRRAADELGARCANAEAELEVVMASRKRLLSEKEGNNKIINKLRAAHERLTNEVGAAKSHAAQLLRQIDELRAEHRQETQRLSGEVVSLTSDNDDLRRSLVLRQSLASAPGEDAPPSLACSGGAVCGGRGGHHAHQHPQQQQAPGGHVQVAVATPSRATHDPPATMGGGDASLREELLFEYSMNLTRYILESFIELEEPEREEDGSLRIEDLQAAAEAKQMRTATELFSMSSVEKMQETYQQDLGDGCSEDEMELLQLQRTMLLEFKKVVNENAELRAACVEARRQRGDSEASLYSMLREVSVLRQKVGDGQDQAKSTSSREGVPDPPAPAVSEEEREAFRKEVRVELEANFAAKIQSVLKERRQEAEEVEVVISEKEGRIAVLEGDVETLQKKLKKARSYAEAKMQRNMQQFTALNTKLHEEIAQVDEVLSKLEEENDVLRAENKKQSAELGRLRTRITDKATDAHRFEAQYSSSQRVITQLRESLEIAEEARDKHAGGAKEAQALQDRVEELAAEAASLRAKNQELVQQIDSRDRGIASELRRVRDRNERLESNLSNYVAPETPDLVLRHCAEDGGSPSPARVDRCLLVDSPHGGALTPPHPATAVECNEGDARNHLMLAELQERLDSLALMVHFASFVAECASNASFAQSRQDTSEGSTPPPAFLQHEPTSEAMWKLLRLGSHEMAAGGMLESMTLESRDGSSTMPVVPFSQVLRSVVDADPHVFEKFDSKTQLRELGQVGIATLHDFLLAVGARTLNSRLRVAYNTAQIRAIVQKSVPSSDLRCPLLCIGWECQQLYAKLQYTELLPTLIDLGVHGSADLLNHVRDPDSCKRTLVDDDGESLFSEGVMERLRVFLEDDDSFGEFSVAAATCPASSGRCQYSQHSQRSQRVSDVRTVLAMISTKDSHTQTDLGECTELHDMAIEVRGLEARIAEQADTITRLQHAGGRRRDDKSLPTFDSWTPPHSVLTDGNGSIGHAEASASTLENPVTGLPHIQRTRSLSGSGDDDHPKTSAFSKKSTDHTCALEAQVQEMQSFYAMCLAPTWSRTTIDHSPGSPITPRSTTQREFEERHAAFVLRLAEVMRENASLKQQLELRAHCPPLAPPCEDDDPELSDLIRAGEEAVQKIQTSLVSGKEKRDRAVRLARQLHDGGPANAGAAEALSELTLLLQATGRSSANSTSPESTSLLTPADAPFSAGSISTSPSRSCRESLVSSPMELEGVYNRLAASFPLFFHQVGGVEAARVGSVPKCDTFTSSRQLAVFINRCIAELRERFTEQEDQVRCVKKELVMMRSGHRAAMENLKAEHGAKWRDAEEDIKSLTAELESLKRTTQLISSAPTTPQPKPLLIKPTLDSRPYSLKGAQKQLPRHTTLHVAARAGDLKRCEELLQREGSAAARAVSSRGATPLHWAAEAGATEVCRLLLHHGAPINAKCTSLGHTPLMDAVVWDHADTVELLLQHGADPHAKNTSGVSPMNSYTSDEVRRHLQLLKAGSVN